MGGVPFSLPTWIPWEASISPEIPKIAKKYPKGRQSGTPFSREMPKIAKKVPKIGVPPPINGADHSLSQKIGAASGPFIRGGGFADPLLNEIFRRR